MRGAERDVESMREKYGKSGVNSEHIWERIVAIEKQLEKPVPQNKPSWIARIIKWRFGFCS
jgi:hypothetical protein